MQQNIYISFVVPVYNTGKYVNECIMSIINSDISSYEIIIVNDGSTDDSYEICSQIAKSSAKISLVNKTNGGLSSARNAGLKVAKGKYVWFVDSDDRINSSSMQLLFNTIKKIDVDIIFLNAIKFYPNGTTEYLGDDIRATKINNEANKKKTLKYLASRPKFPGSACTKMFKKSFLDRKMLQFPNDRRLSEDLGFVAECIYRAESFYSFDDVLYEYRQNRSGSITSTISKNSLDGKYSFICDTISNHLNEKKYYDCYSKYILSFAAYEYAILLWYWFLFNKQNPSEYNFSKIKETAFVLRYGNTMKLRFVYVLTKLVGLNNTAKIVTYIKNKY